MWKKAMKIIILVLLGVAIAGCCVWWFRPPNLTGDGGFKLLEEQRSPSGMVIAKVYGYKGGATVRGFTILVIHSVNERASPDLPEFRVADSEGPLPMKIQWSGNELLLVQFPSAEHRILMKSRSGVEIQTKP